METQYRITPEGAREQIAEIFNRLNEVEKLTLTFEEGYYSWEEPLILDGTSLKNTELLLRADGKVIFSGSRKISDLVWEQEKNGIYSTQLERNLDFDQLFIDEKLCILARYPNYKENVILNGYSEDALAPERVKRWKHPETGYVRAIHGYEWGGNDYRILESDEKGRVKLAWVGDNGRGSSIHSEKRMVENVFEELDSPGEWFYDRTTGKLFYMPENVDELSDTSMELAVNEEILMIKGNRKPVTVQGICFEKTHRTLFSSVYEGLLRSDWTFVRKGAVFVENSEQVRLENCKFRYLGGNAVFFSGYNKDHLVENCDFTDLGASGIMVAGLEKAVRTPSRWGNEDWDKTIRNGEGFWLDEGSKMESVNTGVHQTEMEDLQPGPASEDYPRDICLKNNYFYNVGVYEKQTAGIYVSVSRHVQIESSTFHHMPRSAVTIGDGCFGGHRIVDCDIFDTVRETGDHGPFNSWGRDRFWSFGGYTGDGKGGERKRPYAKYDAMETTVIEHNRITGYAGFGFDLDDGSTNYHIFNNLCLGVGIKCREGFDRLVENNILVDAPLDVHCQYAYNHDLYRNNLILCSEPVRYAGGAEDQATTRYETNLYLKEGQWKIYGKENSVQEIVPVFKNEEKNDYTVMNEDFLQKNDFRNFLMENDAFGKPGAPKPEFSRENGTGKIHMFEKCQGVFRSVGEGDRSANVAPDFYGLVICDYETGSIWDQLVPEKDPYQKKELKNKILRRINGKLLTDRYSEEMEKLLETEDFSVDIWIEGHEEKYIIK